LAARDNSHAAIEDTSDPWSVAYIDTYRTLALKATPAKAVAAVPLGPSPVAARALAFTRSLA